MKKLIVILLLPIFLNSCEDECNERIYESDIILDVSDARIINQFTSEIPTIINQITPSLKRCEGISINMNTIGQKIETPGMNIILPMNGTLDKSLGEYAIKDSNKIMQEFLKTKIFQMVTPLKNTAGDSSSQIFYTIYTAIKNKPNGRLIIYTDLLENYGAVSFYKGKSSFKEVFPMLVKQYSIDTLLKNIVFNGQLSIVSSLESQQQNILAARMFYKDYFNWMGIKEENFEFIGTISETKYKPQKQI